MLDLAFRLDSRRFSLICDTSRSTSRVKKASACAAPSGITPIRYVVSSALGILEPRSAACGARDATSTASSKQTVRSGTRRGLCVFVLSPSNPQCCRLALRLTFLHADVSLPLSSLSHDVYLSVSLSPYCCCNNTARQVVEGGERKERTLALSFLSWKTKFLLVNEEKFQRGD